LNAKNTKGSLVVLRPATIEDRYAIYEWLAHSDITEHLFGTEDTIPTWEQFCDDYKLHFFDGSSPLLGCSFVITVNGQTVGHINYGTIDAHRKRTELDIWMSCEANCGKGFGPDALKTLCRYLSDVFGITEFFINPYECNRRAVRAYEKAGFENVNLPTEELKAEFGPKLNYDTIYMVKKLDT
jgi:diamine N-acetyltransferase